MKPYEKCEGEAEILGHRVDLGRIENPLLRAVLRQRAGKDFLFAYKDHTDHNQQHSDYSDHREYGDHTDHSDRHVDYKDTSYHTI